MTTRVPEMTPVSYPGMSVLSDEEQLALTKKEPRDGSTSNKQDRESRHPTISLVLSVHIQVLPGSLITRGTVIMSE